MGFPHTPRDKIVSVIELHKAGHKNSDISAQTGVNVKTVSRLVAKFRAGGGVAIPEHKHGGGKELKISCRTLIAIRRQLDAEPTLTAKQLKERNPKLLDDVSVRCIQENIQKRLQYKKVVGKRKPPVSEGQRTRRIYMKRPREAVMDAKILKTCGELAKMHIEAAQSNLNVFSPAEFAQKLIIFMNPDGDLECDINEIERPLDFASWKRFGHAVAPLFKRAIGVTNVAAGIGFEQPKPTPKARKTPLDKEVAEKKKPTEIVAPASGEERQTQEVNRIYKLLKARFQENRCQPVDFFSFVINPHSFSLTIENMFHMSFLVRDQFARVTEDKHGIPVISPQKRGDSSHSRDDVSHQCIMSLSKEEWRDIVDTFKIKEPMIPPPANRSGKRKSSGEVM